MARFFFIRLKEFVFFLFALSSSPPQARSNDSSRRVSSLSLKVPREALLLAAVLGYLRFSSFFFSFAARTIVLLSFHGSRVLSLVDLLPVTTFPYWGKIFHPFFLSPFSRSYYPARHPIEGQGACVFSPSPVCSRSFDSVFPTLDFIPPRVNLTEFLSGLQRHGLILSPSSFLVAEYRVPYPPKTTVFFLLGGFRRILGHFSPRKCIVPHS